MTYFQKYELWKNDPFFDNDTKNEILSLIDEKEIEDRFYRELEFGTGGLRGVMAAGTNRMNIYIYIQSAEQHRDLVDIFLMPLAMKSAVPMVSL